MKTNTDNTIKIAFLLALQDLNTSLSAQEKQNLQEIAKQLDIQPKAWKTHIKKDLLAIISANYELNQAYKFYQSQLENLAEIPHEFLPNEYEISSIIPHRKDVLTRGFKPKSQAAGYESQLNNVVVVIGNSEKPEEIVKQATFLGKLKQFLSQIKASN